MKKARFTAERIIRILQEHETGAATADVCLRHRVSSATFYKWKAKYDGLELLEAKRLRSLKDESRRLKKLLAKTMLDNARLRDIATKNW